MFRKKVEEPSAVPSAIRKVEFGDVENLKLSANQFYSEGKYDQAVIGEYIPLLKRDESTVRTVRTVAISEILVR